VLEFRAEAWRRRAHISCVGGTREALAEVLQQYKAHGIHHL